MTDTSQAAGGAPQGQQVPPLTMQMQYIKDFSFENPNAPRSLTGLARPPRIELNVEVKVRPLAENTYEVVLVTNAEARSEEPNEVIFVLELVYGGVVTLGPVPQEAVGPLLLIETPRLLFPFARAIVANTTREAGFPPLNIAPVDFVALFRQQQAAAQAAQAGGSQAPVN